MDHTRAIMAGSDLPKSLWPIAILHFVWIKNRSPTTALQGPTTPFECFFGRKPRLTNLRPWGARVWVLDQWKSISKIDPCTCQFWFVGYAKDPDIIKYWDGAQVLTTHNFAFVDNSMSGSDPNTISGKTL